MSPTAHKIDDTKELLEESFGESILRHLIYSVGKDIEHAVDRDWCIALSLATRDQMVESWIDTTRRIYKNKQKRVYYLSMEFMIGRMLEDNLTNLGLIDDARAFFKNKNIDFSGVVHSEQDAALGNGGLGRLAACFMDSMSTTGVAGMGYNIEFGGTVKTDDDGKAVWEPTERVQAVAFDMPIAGWEGEHVNTLRLWSARPADMMNLSKKCFSHPHRCKIYCAAF